MAALVIDLKQIKALAKKFEKLGKDAMLDISEVLANTTVDLALDGFDRETDPYGRKWKATARGGEILSDSGELKNSIKVKSFSASKFVIDASVHYASTHQLGLKIKHPSRPSKAKGRKGKKTKKYTVKMPVRRFFMVPGQMSSAWLAEYKLVAADVLKKYLT